MKKIITVTFIDGSSQQIDAGEKMARALGPQILGIPANHEIWLNNLQQIACMGVIHDDTDEKQAIYIAPSQIAKVTLTFENGDTMSVQK